MSPPNLPKWASWLIDSGAISREQYDDAVNLSCQRAITVPDALMVFEYVEPWPVTQALAIDLGYPLIDFYNDPIPDDVIRTIPEAVAREFGALPVLVCDSVLWYATPNLFDESICALLAHILNREVRPMWTSRSWIEDLNNRYHGYPEGHRTEAIVPIELAEASASEPEWILVPGNRYQEYVDECDARRRARLQ